MTNAYLQQVDVLRYLYCSKERSLAFEKISLGVTRAPSPGPQIHCYSYRTRLIVFYHYHDISRQTLHYCPLSLRHQPLSTDMILLTVTIATNVFYYHHVDPALQVMEVRSVIQ